MMSVLRAGYSFTVLEKQKEKIPTQCQKMNLIEHHILDYHR